MGAFLCHATYLPPAPLYQGFGLIRIKLSNIKVLSVKPKKAYISKQKTSVFEIKQREKFGELDH